MKMSGTVSHLILLTSPPLIPDACSTERALPSSRQNSLCLQHKFLRALLNTPQLFYIHNYVILLISCIWSLWCICFWMNFLSVFDRIWYFDPYSGKPVPEGKDHNMWGVYSNIYPVCILYRRCKSIIVMEREKGGDNERYLKN